jgi:hypothetical protein
VPPQQREYQTKRRWDSGEKTSLAKKALGVFRRELRETTHCSHASGEHTAKGCVATFSSVTLFFLQRC